MRKHAWFALLAVSCFICVSSQAQVSPEPSGRRRESRPPIGQTPNKAIFEPVNYGQDVNLTDVFFVSPDVGWVSGEHATILKTTDGGQTWKAQVGGDPSGNEKAIRQLRFLDDRHGWAVTDDSSHRLLRTMDGESWEQVAEIPGEDDYTFVSVRRGILLRGNSGGFNVTDDGGRHWREVAPCTFQVTVQGLPQTADCHFIKLQMLSARMGYVFASWRSPEAPNSTTVVLFRTDDAGEHWTYTVTSARGGRPDGYFIDAEHGVLVFQEETYVTSDGGKNWRALLSGGVITDTGDSHVRFADPEAGWSLGDKYPALALSYTTDGGQHWKTFAPLRMPGDPNAKVLSLSLPRRDRAYIVGPHGMIYRYRIVPASYQAGRALEGPLMPGFDVSPLATEAQRVQADIGTLQAQIASAESAAAGSAPGVDSTAAGASTTASAPISTGSATPASDGGFSQDTTAAAILSGDAIAAGASNTSGGGFIQELDSLPASPTVQSCCGAAVQSLQTDLSAFNQAAPRAATQFRSLNLIIAGIQIAVDLLNQAKQLRTSFAALKHAPTLQAASQALQQLSTSINSTQQTITTGFQNPGAYFAATAPASFTQDVGPVQPPMSAIVGTQPQAAPGGTEPTQQPSTGQPAATQRSLEKTVDKAKRTLKDKVKVPW